MGYQFLPTKFELGDDLFNESAHRHISFYDQEGFVRLWLWLEKPLKSYPEDCRKVPLKLRHPTDFSFESSERFIRNYYATVVKIEGYIEGYPFKLKLSTILDGSVQTHVVKFTPTSSDQPSKIDLNVSIKTLQIIDGGY